MNLFKRIQFSTRKIILLLIDILFFISVVAFCRLTALAPDNGTSYELSLYLVNSLILFFAIFFVRSISGIYRSVWRYTNTTAYMKVIISDVIALLISIVVSQILKLIVGYDSNSLAEIWHILIVAEFTSVLTLVSRFFYRQYYSYLKKRPTNDIHKIPVAIVGAGQIGAHLAEELITSAKSNYIPMFFIDADKAKVGAKLLGLKIYDQDDKIIDFIKSRAISEIFIAIASLDGAKASELYNFYKQTGCKIKLYDSSTKDYLAGEDNSRKMLREVQIEDLLFRKAMNMDDSAVKSYYSGKTVLVTGGGGSIGSELCRRIARCAPKKLIILDIYENNAYDIQQELLRKYGSSLDLSVVIASVRDRERIDSVFSYYRPDIVFHAAAHKHVPLMEHSAGEAIKNNIFGTYNVADMAEKYGAEKFILISTDKAVNPTNIMGASKRMCEMIVQCRQDSNTAFSAVRFGNVLGSNGSVVPLFKQQIANGGPITITDKRIIRYFMTIPEASQLVMHAGAIAKRGELFVLDMGKPIKIYDLAVNMIKLSGLELDKDIEIKEVGLRPGEKLYEELLIKTDKLTKTENNMIFIEKDQPLTRQQIEEKLDILSDALCSACDPESSEAMKLAMKKVVPTFTEPNMINDKAESSAEMIASGA